MSAPGPAGDAKQADPGTTSDARAGPGAGAQLFQANTGRARLDRGLHTLLRALARQRRFWIAAVVLVGLVAAAYALFGSQLKAWYHLRAARSDLRAYHNPQAIRHLQACLQIWPEDPDVLILAARAARRARAYDECERGLEKYWKVRGLDDACSLEQLLLTAERDVDQAAPVCRRYVEQEHADTPLILEALTRGYLRQYRLHEARFCLDLWLRKEPENPQALCLDGEFHLDYARAMDAAVDSYRHAVKVDPDHEEARQGLAIVLLETKAFAEAAENLEYLRRAQPDSLRVQVGLAECRMSLGDRDEAVRLVDAVLAQQPEYGPALSLRGRLAVGSEQYAEAESWLRRALARDPSDHDARYNLILCLFNTDRAEEAAREEKVLKQQEDDTKRFNEIVARDLPQRPDDPALHFALGQMLLRSGHAEAGLRWLNSALRLDPQYAPARQALAEYYGKGMSKP